MFATKTLKRTIARWSSSSTGSSKPVNLFKSFPKTFPHNGPPLDPFIIDPRHLRREYRLLQSASHPDKSSSVRDSVTNDAGQASLVINRAYTTILNPYLRAAHFIHLVHPRKIDITQDDESKAFIANYQQSHLEEALQYKDMLLQVMESHEILEFATSESDLLGLVAENKERVAQSEQSIEQLSKQDPIHWDQLIMQTIRLKYWVNIENAIRDWEPGKAVHLLH